MERRTFSKQSAIAAAALGASALPMTTWAGAKARHAQDRKEKSWS